MTSWWKIRRNSLKTLVLLVVMALLVTSVAAQTITQRFDVEDGKSTNLSTYVQGLPGGIELWGHNLNTPTPMYRIGMMKKTSFGKAGGYFATKNGQNWVNPRLIFVSKMFGPGVKIVVDEYEPITSGAKRIVTLSDAYKLCPVSKTVSVGPGLNGSWTRDGAKWLKGAIVITAKINKSDSLYVRWNCIGNDAPDSLRMEWSHSL